MPDFVGVFSRVFFWGGMSEQMLIGAIESGNVYGHARLDMARRFKFRTRMDRREYLRRMSGQMWIAMQSQNRGGGEVSRAQLL